jgi:hypothetical protein
MTDGAGGTPDLQAPMPSCFEMDALTPDPPKRNPPCPFLPPAEEALGPWVTRRHEGEKGPGFYFDALRYAQWLWGGGKPAQAILQLNKAWMAVLAADERVLDDWPPPYAALAWILRAARQGDCGFIGNPVRHFQHLASRMSGPRAESRAWRAWACFHLAERVLGPPGFPRDGEQLVREGLWIPSAHRTLNELALRGWTGEAGVAAGCYCDAAR